MIVYMCRVVFSPSASARIILSERKDDPGTRMILPPFTVNGLTRPSLPTILKLEMDEF